MTVLTITASDIVTTARRNPGDAGDLADAAFVIASEQAAAEARITPAALGDGSLTALLTRNVVKLLAAELLEMQSREAGATGTFQAAGVTIGQERDHPARLRAEAYAALNPFLRFPVGVGERGAGSGLEPTFVGPEVPVGSLSVQEALFGPTEAGRREIEEAP